MSKKRSARTIALDFDGVLHSYAGYKGGLISGPIPGAVNAVNKLLAAGHTVVVFSTRPRPTIVDWLGLHGCPALEVTDIIFRDCRRPRADV
jgi:trehalose-6-phosphatase